jgi:hypothetical protein
MTIYRVAYVAARLFYFGGKAMAKNTLDDAIAGLKDLAKEVKRYCERLISNAKFDRTAVGTIVKVLDDHSGYVVAAFGKEYTIASNALFQVNDAVAVIAPQNDFKRLYIKPYEIDRNLLKQDKVEEDLKDYVNKVDKLQEQVDGKVEQYFYNYDPTLENWPAMSWKDDTTKKAHNGDLFYNTDSKKGWQWTYNEETKTGSWVEVTDKETLDTLEAASKAQDTGDGKRQVFTADASKGEYPEPPYDTGDLWFNGEDILVCTVARTASDKYNASDWVKKDNYTNKDEVIDAVDKKLTQEDIFNRLTNNGASQGMFIEDGNVYFNATYIKSGEINSDLIKTGKISSKDGNVYFDLDNSVIHTTDGQYVTTLDKNSIIVKSSDNILAQLHGQDTSYGTENPTTISDALLHLACYAKAQDSDTTSFGGSSNLSAQGIEFITPQTDGTQQRSYFCSTYLETNEIRFRAVKGRLKAQMNGSDEMLISDFATTQLRGNAQLYKTGNSVPGFYIYDGTTNWGGQTLGWDGNKEVTVLGASTQAVPFVYGIELVKNAQGYVTDVKLKQHGLRFIGGILV